MKDQVRHIHKQLIEQSKRGNRQAQYDLYNQYADAMFAVCCRMLDSAADAEDALQEAFVSAFQKLNSFRYESTFGAWLKRIVINQCITFLRSKQTLQPMEQVYGLAEEDDYDEDDERLYKIQKVKAGIKLLPGGYREILQLYLLEGYDHKEISEILGISVATSKSQYHRAKKKLASHIMQ